MPRYVFKIIAHADRPNKVLVGQLLPGYTHMVFSKKFSEVSMGAWGKLWTLCPEEIDWASVTHLEIMYDELPYRDLVHPTGIWTYNIEFDDGHRAGQGNRDYFEYMARDKWEIRVAREDEYDLRRKVFNYLAYPDILGLQKTRALHWVSKFDMDSSSESD